MKRYAIPLVSVICLALWSCAQSRSPPPPARGALITSVTCPDGSGLLSHVQYVNLEVEPSGPPNAPMAVQPNTDFSIPPDPTMIDSAIQSDLAAAFTANPNFAKRAFCPPTGNPALDAGRWPIDGIFINLAGCSTHDPSSCSSIQPGLPMQDAEMAANSWGLRTPSGKKYIAISLGLWRCPPQSKQTICSPTLSAFHTKLNQALFDKTAGEPPGQHVSGAPQFQTSASNDVGLAVLSALAHERGHIYWWEIFVQPPGAPHATNTNLFCGSGASSFYPNGIWEGRAVDIPMARFVPFADLAPNSPLRRAKTSLRVLLRSGQRGEAVARALIDGIYTGGKYSSLFAAYSPDEDFVESFEWSVLSKGEHGDLSWTADNIPVLEKGHGHLPGVENKLRCFDALSDPPTPKLP